MKQTIMTVLTIMPVWFGIGFLGPVLAELTLRTPLGEALGITAEPMQIYAACMAFGGAYGLVAWRTGRWI